MKVHKIKTTTEEENINSTFDKIPEDLMKDWKRPIITKDVLSNVDGKEEILSFTDYRINPSHPHENLTLILDLLKSKALSEVPEHQIIDILKGKSYVKKTVTTEYFIIENNGEDLTKRLNDDYIAYLASDNPGDLPEDKQYIQQGHEIITLKEDKERRKIF